MMCRFCRVLVVTSGLAAVGSFAVRAAEVKKKTDAAEISFAEPLIGYVYDPGNGRIRSILGVPGAARVAESIALDATLANAVLGAGGKIAIASVPDADASVLIRPVDEAPGATPISGSMKMFQLAAFSATGTAAILFGTDCNCLQVAGSFADSPAISRVIDTTALPGTITAVAINNDASFAAAAVPGLEDGSQGPQVLVFDLASDAPPRVVMSSSASGLAFSPDGKDLAVVDVKTHSLSLVRDVAGDAAVTNVAGDGSGLSMPTAVAFVDTTSVLISDRSGLVQLVNLGTNELKSITCYCKPDTVEPMTLKSTYRLTGLQTGAMWILNLTDSEATLRFVPVDSGDGDGSQTGNEQ